MCEKCPFGYYLIEPAKTVQPCKACTQNAICNGTNILAPKPGYYRPNMSNDLIMECYNDVACLGGTPDNLFGNCEKGYTGFLCGSCEPMHHSKNWRTCNECPSSSISTWFAVILFLKVTLIVFLIWWLNFNFAETGNVQYRNIMT